MTSASPAKTGIVPMTRSAATIRPQSSTGTGLRIVARIDGVDGGHRPDIAVEQQRKGHDGHRQHDERKDEADEIAPDDQLHALLAC